MKFIGIDLAASEKNPTGLATLEKNKKTKITTKILFTNREILEEIKKSKPKVVAIDAPLFLPLGRKNLRKSKIHFRSCDKELLKMKIKFFPISIGPMRSLTKRGISLRKTLEKMKIKVIETFPGAIYDILGINRKNPSNLKKFIKFNPKGKSIHEIDAIACAYIAKLFSEGKVRKIGNRREGYMYIPVNNKNK